MFSIVYGLHLVHLSGLMWLGSFVEFEEIAASGNGKVRSDGKIGSLAIWGMII
jgi:hypothetical protein